MEAFVSWCNENTGFLTGILSLLTLIVSIIAVVISIHTARLPFMKRLILSSNITVILGTNNLTGAPVSQFAGITVPNKS